VKNSNRNRTVTRKVLPLLVAAAATASLSVAGAISNRAQVTTYGYSNVRSGVDSATGPITGLASSATWTTHLDGSVHGEPLLYGGYILVATEHDTIYALYPTSGMVAWHLHVATPVATSVIDQAPGLGSYCGNINPLGITGTPVIDSAHNVIYVATEEMDGANKWQNIRHRLYAVSLRTHKVLWQRLIDPPGGNTANGYTIAAQQQRPALTLAYGHVYVNFGGLAGDCGKYHGWVVGVASNGVGALIHYQVPTNTEGAVWATNGAIVTPAGNLIIDTGNGSSTSTFDGSNAVVELSPALKVLSQWAPTDWANLSAQDWDLGSAGPVPVPGTSNLLFVAGKHAANSYGYLVHETALGSGPAAALYTGEVCTDPTSGVFGSDAAAMVNLAGTRTPVVFVACANGTEALAVTGGATPSFARLWGPSTAATPGPPIVAGGYVWSLSWNTNQLAAMNPATGAVVWTRSTVSLNNFAIPTIGDGLVIVPGKFGVQGFATTP
jgi:polyvinyl alcohol dehydrogenase (cytochrome)